MALDDFILDVTVPNPGAGNEIAITIPSGVWRVVSFCATLTTSAVVANRTFQMIWRQGVNAALFIFLQAAGLTQAASLTNRYVGARGIPSSAALIATNSAIIQLPADTVLTGGDTVSTSTVNLDPGDAYSNVMLRLERLWRP